jgi:hypothetical protein
MTGIDLTTTTPEAHELRASVRAEVEQEYLRLRTVDRPALLDALARSAGSGSSDARVIEDELALLDRRIAAIRRYLGAVRGPAENGCAAVDYCVQVDLGDGPQWVLLTDLPVLDDRVVVTDSPLGKALLGTPVGEMFVYRTPHGSHTGKLLAVEGACATESEADPDTPMFAPERRLTELDRERSLELLRDQSPGVGRLAFTMFGIPHIEVVNFLVDENSDVIFRIDPGSKLVAVLHGGQFAFQVEDIDLGSRSGWTVTVSGPAERVTGPAAEDLLGRVTPWAAGERRFVVRLRPRAVQGRALVPEQAAEPVASAR